MEGGWWGGEGGINLAKYDQRQLLVLEPVLCGYEAVSGFISGDQEKKASCYCFAIKGCAIFSFSSGNYRCADEH